MSDMRIGCLVIGPDKQPQGRSVPLAGVRVEARLFGLCSEVTVTQRYENTEPVPVECVYVFPLQEDAAVSGFQARIGDRVIQGRVEERDQAFETYDDAMADGHGAFLLDQERPNIFTASVGNLEPGQEVEVAITYVALVAQEGDAVRFMLPTTISPRYVPGGARAEPEVGEPDSDRVNPERWTQVPYGLHLSVALDMNSPIAVVESPSHTIRTEMDGSRAQVTLSSRETALDRDFVLLVETRAAHQPSARVAQEPDGTRVAMVTFTPGSEDLPSSHGNEIIFVLDCSGSMRGDSIDEARRALALFVRAMSEDDTFNIVRFGSRFTSLWQTPQPYSDANLAAATQYIRASDADLGGTEILSPLQEIYRHQVDAKRPRQILLLTDGQVFNEDEVIALCEQHAASTRVFAFGIGAGASEHLVRGVARASRGAAELIYPGERIEPKVLRMFGRVSTPALTDVRIDWGGLRVEQAPAAVPPVFGGDSLTVFARVLDGGGQAGAVTLTSREKRWQVPLDLERADKDRLIPTLWARRMIRDLEGHSGAPRGSSQSRRRHAERVDKRRERLIALGVRYGLMSSATSYVAVEERPADQRTTAQAELRRIPIALTSGWGGRGGVSLRGRGARMGAPMSSPMMSAPLPSLSDYIELECELLPVESPAARPSASRPRSRPAAHLPAASRMAPSAYYGQGSKLEGGRERVVDGNFRLFELLLTQSADGSFRMSPVLRAWLGAHLLDVEWAIVQHGEALVATAVVIALLEKRAPERAPEWTPAVNKARRWLDKQAQGFDASGLV